MTRSNKAQCKDLPDKDCDDYASSLGPFDTGGHCVLIVVFVDVLPDYWAEDYICAIFKAGITTGCFKNPLRYCPQDDVTRAQMAVFLLRAKHGSNYNPPAASVIFDDVPVTYWAADWIEQLSKEGITKGCGTNPLRYCPEDSVKRAQMAVFIVRTFGL